jgi:hypothetical protein
MDPAAMRAHTGWMDTRRRRLTRRSALTAVAASAIVALTGLAGSSAVAATRPAAPSAPVTTPAVLDLRLPSASMPHAVPPSRAGSCSVAMMDL